jgi:hypothetical protein
MEQRNYMQVIQPDYKIEIGIKDGKAISLHWGQLVDNEKQLTNKEILRRVEKYLREGLKLHLKQNNSFPVEAEVRQKTADIGITEQPEKPEDMPKTITVITEDFIRLITIAGSLCHPKAPSIYKQRMNGELRKIAVRHHINYVGEIKENDSRFSV